MSRKTLEFTVSDDRQVREDTRELDDKGTPIGKLPDDFGQPIGEQSRDLGKKFRITEMPASKAERWAIRALLALAKSGVELPDGALQGGMRVLAYLGLQALTNLNFEDAEPLLDEMMGCVQIVEPKLVRSLTDDDIEEVKTRIMLRQKILELHVGFSGAGSA
jgi:hypothetical protein